MLQNQTDVRVEAECREYGTIVEDALNATRAAGEEGVVPGSGVVFLRAGKVLDAMALELEMQLGVTITKKDWSNMTLLRAQCREDT
ncbi:hypothetical protein ACFL27_20840 [candidate division CSSED10-310 bacterium]|uniref:Uncharacterized protein n=1 Tax=candidate division CSSED10-310 bacterium TaxID=2855610 RepID=A0ABV6Z2H1_UNCC1